MYWKIQMLAKTKVMFENGETVEFTGIAIAHLTSDKNIMKKSGKVLISSNLSREYGFIDVDGKTPEDMRSIKYLLKTTGNSSAAKLFPSFIRIPMPIAHFMSYRF